LRIRSGVVSDELGKQILDSIGARAVAMKMGTRRRMLAIDDMPPSVAATYDMRNVYAVDAIIDAFATMLNNKKDVMRVVGPAPMCGEYIELVMDEQPLRKAMLRYSADILFLSLVISAITAALVYLALHYMFVRPMRHITANMIAFRADPEDNEPAIVPSTRVDEIGIAERELATMQSELASMLHQKSRLAGLALHRRRSILIFSKSAGSNPEADWPVTICAAEEDFAIPALANCYRSRDWEGALEAIDLCRSSENNFGLTGLFGLYRARIEAFRESAPPPDWAGVFVAETK
jgi:hypothetical protein